MQSRNFFLHLRFILTVFEHKCLQIGDTHEAQYTFRMFCYQERPFDRKDKVSSFILPEILVKNAGINKITPQKLIHYLLENALTDFVLISPTSCLN